MEEFKKITNNDFEDLGEIFAAFFENKKNKQR